MKRNWSLFTNKVLMTFVAALLAATSALAFPRGPEKNNTDVVCDDQIKPGPFAFTFAKDLGLSCPADFYFFGSFLWMKPQEEGLEWAVINTTAPTGGSNLPLTGGELVGFSTESRSWDWNPGLRVGFGVYLNHDAWNIELAWTFMRIKDDSSCNYNGAGTVGALWLPTNILYNDTNKNTSARWKGDLNCIDLSLAKPFHVSRYFVWSPMYALRFAFINQNYTARYSGNFNNATEDGVDFKAHNDFYGFGPKAGLNTEWILGNNFNLYANIAWSMLFGKFDIKEVADLYDDDFDIDWKQYSVVPTMEFMFGISWGRFFNKNKCLFTLKVGYEFHQWWSQNRLRRFIDSQSTTVATMTGNIGVNGDLSFNGFNFGLQFDF